MNKKTGTRMTREKRKPDIDHHLSEWTSGKRGGGKVPADLSWRTNPKQYQEELGANVRDPRNVGTVQPGSGASAPANQAAEKKP